MISFWGDIKQCERAEYMYKKKAFVTQSSFKVDLERTKIQFTHCFGY